jgi:hypothetical protein
MLAADVEQTLDRRRKQRLIRLRLRRGGAAHQRDAERKYDSYANES